MSIRIIVTALILSISLPSLATTAKIYVWRNEQGVLVFSDSPKPGAEESEEVSVKPGNVVKSNVDTSILDITPKEIEEKYQVEITQPEDHSTIRDNTGSVHVTGRIKPVFKRGLKIQLLLDDAPYGKPQTHSMFALRNIDRGEHKIKMQLTNSKGKVIASSQEVTFYMHRASSVRQAR
ncbi:DUF4124 domain-containing protein [Thalassotalea sp. PLHSN55]|uniref:DUF4124 domain-containing protein n=1 Tax=Thalassotalea sp. PLHSN55 TaxID=3435888 RepID=UPI003F878B39